MSPRHMTQVFQMRHFADVPELNGPALPHRPPAYLADPEVQDTITVPVCLTDRPEPRPRHRPCSSRLP